MIRKGDTSKSAATTWLRLATAVLVLLGTGACTTVIIPPAAVEQPRPAFILDHGRHTSLVLPHPQGLVRYAYGDWDWYAEVNTGPVEASRAILWPSRAALGRSLIRGSTTEQSVRRGLVVGIENLYRVSVESEAVEALRASLDRLHEANRQTLKYNAAYGLAFVPHPEPYTLGNNSNHKVAQWLEQLGCTIEGGAYWARWRVREPAVEGTPYPDGGGK